MRGSIPGPWDHDLSRRQKLNPLSHPGAPTIHHLIKQYFKVPDYQKTGEIFQKFTPKFSSHLNIHFIDLILTIILILLKILLLDFFSFTAHTTLKNEEVDQTKIGGQQKTKFTEW